MDRPPPNLRRVLSRAKRILGLKKRKRKKPKQAIDVLALPEQDELVKEFRKRAASSDALSRCLTAVETGTFTHRDGRTEDLGTIRHDVSELALLSHLCIQCPKPLTLEVGFGMGMSATAMIGTLALRGRAFEHLIFDPYGLGDGKGLIVSNYLIQQFGRQFRWLRQRSDIGLAATLAKRGRRCAGLIFIDGSHRFEYVMTDFALADQLCCVGGVIVFDDALFPAIETVMNYISSNRPDYVVANLIARKCSVAQKIGPDRREWFSFKPFSVPKRCDWTSADSLEEKPINAQRSSDSETTM